MVTTVIFSPNENNIQTTKTGRTVVLQSLEKSAKEELSSIGQISGTISNLQTDTEKKIVIANTELSKLEQNTNQLLTEIVSLYISIGRASEAALVMRRVYG